jgi:hypothetical protein
MLNRGVQQSILPCKSDYFLSWLFNDAVSIEIKQRQVAEYGAIVGMRIRRENQVR